MLKIDHVQLGYRNRTPVIRDLSLNLEEGELFVLIGPNGCGKTTLLRGISGALPLRSGSIFYKDRSIHGISPLERAKIFSVVPQFSELPDGFSVFDCVSHGRAPYTNWSGKLTREDISIIEESLLYTELSDIQNEVAAKLSGGQQQRVLLARVFAQRTPIILMDEPNTFLDLRYQIRLLELIKKQCQKKGNAVLLILHDLNLAFHYADRIALLENGDIIRCGTPQEVCDVELLSSVFHTPLRVLSDKNDHSVFLPF